MVMSSELALNHPFLAGYRDDGYKMKLFSEVLGHETVLSGTSFSGVTV